jgi:hypothetical protein
MDKAKDIVTQGATDIYHKLDKAITDPSSCENVDIEQIEEEVLNAADTIQDFMLNIDLTKS